LLSLFLSTLGRVPACSCLLIWLLPSAPAPVSSVFVFILVVVEIFLFNDIKLDGVESDYFQISSTLFT
jgi:hypothetical protein